MTLLAIPPKRGKLWKFQLGSKRVEINPDKASDVDRAANYLGVDAKKITSRVEEVRYPDAPRVSMSARDPGGDVWSRQGSGAVELLDQAIATEREFIRWDSLDDLAALDYDTIAPARFSEAYVQSLVYQAIPQPDRLWVTLHGGIRCIFTRTDHLTAREMAGACALMIDISLRGIDRCELLANTRTPRGNIMEGVSQSLPALRSRLLTRDISAPSDGDISHYCEERGYTIGRRYDHDVCPIEPCADGQRHPVHVLDEGIMCYRCRGTRGDGWRSWSHLIDGVAVGDEPANVAAMMAYHHVHWGHARYVLAAHYPYLVPDLWRYGYAGVLKILHGPDYDASAIFRKDLSFFRSGSGLWVDDATHQPRTISHRTAATMPAGRSGASVDLLLDTCAIPGYIPVTPLLGVAEPSLSRPDSSTLDTREIYIPSIVRGLTEGSSEDPWGELAAYLPGWSEESETLLKILLVGAFRQQYEPAMPSMVLVTGPTGSGKGAITALAAGILGQRCVKLDLGGDRAEWSRALGQATEGGAAYAMIDEVGKIRGFWGSSSPLLELTSEIHWRKLYSGHVTSPLRSCIVLAGSTLPVSMPGMSELGRRLAVVHLPHRIGDWATACRQVWGVPLLERLRDGAGVGLCNALFAWAKDTALAQIATPWVQQCLDFGADPLAASDEDDAVRAERLIRPLYDLWCSGPDSVLFPPEDVRWGAAEWLDATLPYDIDSGVEAPNAAGRLLVPWISDENPKSSGWVGLVGVLETTDLGEAIGPECAHLAIQVRRVKRRVAIRFVTRGTKRARPRSERSRRWNAVFPSTIDPDRDQ